MQDMITEAEETFKALREMKVIESEDLDKSARSAIKHSIETLMQIKREDYIVGARSYGISDRKNGYYARTITSKVGDIEVEVPRTRNWSPAGMLKKYARRLDDVTALIRAGFLDGLSTRQVAREICRITGVRISATTVSNVAKQLDGEIKRFHRRKLSDVYRFLMFDGIVVKVKTGTGSVKKTILVAVGLLPDGTREIIDYKIASSESSQSWTAFLINLEKRGLTGESLDLVVIDGNGGLFSAVDEVYNGVKIQRCWEHKTRNIVNDKAVASSDRKAMRKALSNIRDAAGQQEARKLVKTFVNEWGSKYPKAVRQLKKDLDELLNFYKLEKDWWVTLRTTNLIERVQREIRRRFRPIGAAYDKDSLERIAFSAMSAKKFRWTGTKRAEGK